MSAKRGSRVPRPTAATEWSIRFGNKNAGKAWTELGNSKLATPLAKLWDILADDPRWSGNPDRHHRLKGQYATKTYDGRELELWQHEITSGGRVWFLVDDQLRTVWLVYVGEGHPSETD